MADVERLLLQFIAEDRAGGVPDPLVFLEQVSGTDRDELEALIDRYLSDAPRRPFDAAAFAGSPARSVAEDLGRSLAGTGGAWPALLPRLRHRARLRRAELVARLSAELGVAGREAKVGAYYHQMEQGTLPASGVSDRVLEALGRILGERTERLREAGASLRGTRSGAEADVAFARLAEPDPDFAEAPAPLPPAPAADSRRDEVDELFTGASGDAA